MSRYRDGYKGGVDKYDFSFTSISRGFMLLFTPIIAYTIGLPVQAIGILTAKIYNVLQKNTILMYVAGASIGLNIFFNWTFMKIWGHIGIALSTSGVYFVTTGVLLYILHQKLWKRQI